MKTAQRNNIHRSPLLSAALIVPFATAFLGGAGSSRMLNHAAYAAAPMSSATARQATAGQSEKAASQETKPLALASDQSRLNPPLPVRKPLDGIVFRGRPAALAQAKAQMRAWLAALKCPPQIVLITDSLGQDEVGFTLNTPAGDTDTLTLAERLNWAMPAETIAFQDRDDVSRTREVVSVAEVLAAMMQHGRTFLFGGDRCSVDRLREHVAIRRNIVYWGSRAEWIFPDPFIPRFNAALWSALEDGEWTLKPGVPARRAIADAFEGGPAYELGCKSACQFIMAHGVLDYFARLRPDRALLARLEQRIDPVHPLTEIEAKADKQGVIRRPGRLADRQFHVAWNNWVPGDWGWIKNTDNASSNELCAEGSNVIYGGGGKFVNYYADGPLRTLDQSLKRVYGWRFGEEDGDLEVPDVVLRRLRVDPRDGGLLRDVRDVPPMFDAHNAPAPPQA